jgi:hypothetical protein
MNENSWSLPKRMLKGIYINVELSICSAISMKGRSANNCKTDDGERFACLMQALSVSA